MILPSGQHSQALTVFRFLNTKLWLSIEVVGQVLVSEVVLARQFQLHEAWSLRIRRDEKLGGGIVASCRW